MKTRMKKLSILFGLMAIFVMTFSLVGSIHVVSAAGGTYTLLEPLPAISKDNATATMPPKIDLDTYIQDTLNLIIALSAIAAVFMIVYGGLIYMTAESFGKKNDGLEKLQNAVIGLLMVLSTYLILRTVNPKLVDIAVIPKLEGLATTSLQSLAEQLQEQTADISMVAAADAQRVAASTQTLTERINLTKQQIASSTNPTERATLETQLRNDRITHTEQESVLQQNQYLSQYVNSSATIQSINEGQTASALAYNTAISHLREVDSSHSTSALENQYNYTWQMMQVAKINLIIGAARAHSSGSWSASSPPEYTFTNPSTERIESTSDRNYAYNQINASIDSINLAAEHISDPTLSQELLRRTATLRSGLGSSALKQ